MSGYTHWMLTAADADAEVIPEGEIVVIVANYTDNPLTPTGEVRAGDGTTGGKVVSGTGAAWGAITGTLGDQTDLASALAGKAASSHTHTLSAVTDAGTAAALDVGEFDVEFTATAGLPPDDDGATITSPSGHTGAPDYAGQQARNTAEDEVWEAVWQADDSLAWEQITTLEGEAGQILRLDADNNLIAETQVATIPFFAAGTDLSFLASTSKSITLPRAWKVTAFDYLVAGGSTTLTLEKEGVASSEMTGANAATLDQTSRTSVNVTGNNTGTSAQKLTISFGAISGTLTLLDLNITVQRNGA